MQVAGTLVEQVVYDPTGFGPDRLELLTGHGWIDIEASRVPTGVITLAAGDETHLGGKVDINRDGTKRHPRFRRLRRLAQRCRQGISGQTSRPPPIPGSSSSAEHDARA